jgi:hypothetical protein
MEELSVCGVRERSGGAALHGALAEVERLRVIAQPRALMKLVLSAR